VLEFSLMSSAGTALRVTTDMMSKKSPRSSHMAKREGRLQALFLVFPSQVPGPKCNITLDSLLQRLAPNSFRCEGHRP
jgi:hypothetical protein